jgi:hypothetical protein
MKKLKIRDCELTGTLPTELDWLWSLEEMEVSSNQLTGKEKIRIADISARSHSTDISAVTMVLRHK